MKTPVNKKEKDKGGRPPKYLPKYATDEYVDQFISVCRDNSKPETLVLENGITHTRKRLMLPTVERFAKHIGVHKDSLYEWATKYPKFSVTIDKVKEIQKEWLMDNGLTGEYNPMIAKLILSNNHKMSDKVDNTINDKNGVIRSLFTNTIQNDGGDATETT